MHRWMLVGAGAVVTVVGVLQGGPELANAVAELEDRVMAIEERLTMRPIGTSEAGGVRFEGRDNAVSEPFPLVEGTALFTFVVEEGYVTASLLPAPGSASTGPIALFAEQGSAETQQGTVAESIPAAGEYVLAVEGDGSWVVISEQ